MARPPEVSSVRFCRALIDVGYHHAIARRAEVLEFLGEGH